MKRILAAFVLALGLSFCLPSAGSAASRDSIIEKVVQRGTLRGGFSSFVPWAMQD